MMETMGAKSKNSYLEKCHFRMKEVCVIHWTTYKHENLFNLWITELLNRGRSLTICYNVSGPRTVKIRRAHRHWIKQWESGLIFGFTQI